MRCSKRSPCPSTIVSCSRQLITSPILIANLFSDFFVTSVMSYAYFLVVHFSKINLFILDSVSPECTLIRKHLCHLNNSSSFELDDIPSITLNFPLLLPKPFFIFLNNRVDFLITTPIFPTPKSSSHHNIGYFSADKQYFPAYKLF